MKESEKIKKVRETVKCRNKLQQLGICGIVGPTGPRGKGIEIKGTFDSLNELERMHPTGEDGDCYIIDGELYMWDSTKNNWSDAGNFKGDKGDSETISINSTITGEPNDQAQVIDTVVGLNHNLDFIIPRGIQGPTGSKGEIGPKGEKGEQGPKGDIGPTGPAAPVSATSYAAILFASYAQARYSRIMAFQDIINIPDNNDVFDILNDTEFSVKQPGLYEITLCGQISGVDQSHGAIFYLSDSTGTVVQDLSFELKAGATSRMDCSETIITKIENPTKLYVTCGIIGEAASAQIDFANVNLIIKKYNQVI